MIKPLTSLNNQMTEVLHVILLMTTFKNHDAEFLYEVGIESQVIKIWHIFCK